MHEICRDEAPGTDAMDLDLALLHHMCRGARQGIDRLLAQGETVVY